MKVRREGVGTSHEVDHVRRAVHWLERADAKEEVGLKPDNTYLLVKRTQEFNQRRPRIQVAAIRSEMDARERDFFETCRRNAVHFLQNSFDRHTDRFTSRRRDDAVGTRLRTSGLHPQRERGSSCDTRLNHGAAAAPAITESLERSKGPAEAGHHVRSRSAPVCRRLERRAGRLEATATSSGRRVA